MAKFDPLSRKNYVPVITKICIGDYVLEACQPAKFYPDQIRDFFSLHDFMQPFVYLVIFFFFILKIAHSQDACTNFDAKYVKDVVRCKDVPFLGH